MPITLDGTLGITTPTYGGADAAEYLVPVTAFKNRIINGAMVISQRNGTSSVTPTDGQYVLDRWVQLQAVASKYSVQQNAGSVTPPNGFRNYLGVTSLSAYTVGAGEYFLTVQRIEGFNVADLMWGTANAQTVTVSFWVRSSLTGTFGGSVTNAANNRSYPFTYTISSANTWEYKTVTIPGDTTGTWATDNTTGMQLKFGLGVGSSLSGPAGAWAGSDFASATGATSVVGTNGATFYITGVQLEVGTNATFFDARPYGTELALCQRYLYRTSGSGNTRHAIAGNGSLAQSFPAVFFKVSLRGTPTVSFSSLSHFYVEGLTGGGLAVPTGIAYNAGTTETAALNVTSGGGSTAVATQLLGIDANAALFFNAEL